VFNAIKITGNAVGDTMFYGRGAGKLPTASAVVGDIADIAKDVKTRKCNEWGPGAKDLVQAPDELTFRWYVRANANLDDARKVCGEITPLARGGAPASEIAFLTEAMTQAQLNEKLAGVEVLSSIRVLA
jgi:homoserine dehydrogenase